MSGRFLKKRGEVDVREDDLIMFPSLVILHLRNLAPDSAKGPPASVEKK